YGGVAVCARCHEDDPVIARSSFNPSATGSILQREARSCATRRVGFQKRVHPRPSRRGCNVSPVLWCFVGEARDRLDATIGGDLDDVRANEMQGCLRLSTSFPLEARAIVMRLDRSLQLEAIGGRELVVHRGNHVADAIMPFAAARRVNICRVVRVGFSDQCATLVYISFVPSSNVTSCSFV